MIQFGLRLHDAEKLPIEQVLPLVHQKGFSCVHLALSKSLKEVPNTPSALTPGYAAYLRRLFADNGVVWQLSEMGKVDQGGGGTIAKFMADRNIDTIDAGVPVLSMHAPFELVAKFDCWMTYRGVLAAYCDTQA